MSRDTKHISVCICTFKRPDLLMRLLQKTNDQHTEGLFSYSVVIVDNDSMQSARKVVIEFAASSSIPTIYCVEPEQNIALARNKAVENAKGDFIAFIDDDEIPDRYWLGNLFKTCSMYNVDGILGPVKPYFEHQPPQWVVKGKFFERATYDTGYKLRWSETRSGNVLFRREILSGIDNAFRPEFGTGSEDTDFFRRMMQKGRVFVWCNEAVVYELVPPSRCTRSYLLRRAVLIGGNSHKHPTHRISNLAKSVVAVPLYIIALPIFVVFGQHMFMRYLTKLFYHASRILAFLRWNLVQEKDINSQSCVM